MAARGPAVNDGTTNLHCLCWGSYERWKKEKKTTQRREKQDRGWDADICKRSDTDLEKASSLWLAHEQRREAHMWLSEHGEVFSPLIQPVHFSY